MDHSFSTTPKNNIPKICFMGYYKLRELAEPAICEYSNRAQITSIDASFDKTLSIARQLIENEQVDAFVSAGSNAAILREHLQLPVISIEVTGYDLLRSLMEAKHYGKKIGVISYQNALPPLHEFTDLLNLDLYEFTYSSTEEAIACIQTLEKKQVDVIIGSSLIFDLAHKRNLNCILSYSLDSIYHAFNQALEVCRIKQLESNRFLQINNILQTLPEAVVAVDVNERITAINKKMKNIISPATSYIYGMVLSEFDEVLSLKNTLKQQELSPPKAIQLGGKSWFAVYTQILESHPFENQSLKNSQVIGATLTLYDANTIRHADEKLRILARNNTQSARYHFDDIFGETENMKAIIQKAKRYANTSHDILIVGETGTGKELFAQSIHNASDRANKPFIAINCAAFPESLIESELFGHEDGAFTGAKKGGRKGLIEAAHTGTLFLDEIGDMPIALQTRLLRVLQEREITRLGATTPIPIDIRLIAATHQHLKQQIKAQKFRQDLFFRINTLQINIPPLRERKQDIATYFKLKIEKHLHSKSQHALFSQLLKLITPLFDRHAWSGNFRELESITQRIILSLSIHPPLSVAEIVQEIQDFFNDHNDLAVLDSSFNDDEINLFNHQLLKHQEIALRMEKERSKKQQALKAMQLAQGQHTKAAHLLGISRTTLWRWLNESV